MPLQATSGAASYDAFGGGVPYIPQYIEEVFSTWLYTGTGSALTINNGIDLAGKGGMTLLQSRSNNTGSAWNVYDTNRGVQKYLLSSGSDQEATAGAGAGLTAFNANGFTLGTNWNTENFSPYTYVSWTFRKQPKFFDVVTYTGNGANRTIAHNLGSTPGFMLVKRVSGPNQWMVYHRGLTSAANVLLLNTTTAEYSSPTTWNSTAPTSTVFSLGTDGNVNLNGSTYVAYLFAHDAGGFGLTGTDNVISCGSFTTDGSGSATVSLGYEPQWLLVKNTQLSENWVQLDNMRGWSFASQQRLFPNLSNAEQSLTGNYGTPTATGFNFVNGLGNSNTYIYIAIRRPMKVPTTGTSVFAPLALNNATGTVNTTSFPLDLQMIGWRGGAPAQGYFFDRLRGFSSTTSQSGLSLTSSSQDADTSRAWTRNWNNTSFETSSSLSSSNIVYWNFRRAPGFFDEICYDGQNTTITLNHNLTVPPELIIVKTRSQSSDWFVQSSYFTSALSNYILLNNTSGRLTSSNLWGTVAPNSTQFQITGGSSPNNAGRTYVAYLFASCPGVSKVGSYTGNGSSQTINCGFTGGARFVLIKRTDSTGDWYVWDTARGIVAGNDPHLSLNTTAAEVTSNDTIDTDSTGFVVNQVAATNVNVNAATYIYLAIA